MKPDELWIGRESAKAIARQWLQEDVLILDSETTDVGPTAEVCELAIIDTASTVMLNTLLKPVGALTPGAAAVNGLSNVQLADAPTLLELLGQLESLLADPRPIVTYNARFDWTLLLQSLLAQGGKDWHASQAVAPVIDLVAKRMSADQCVMNLYNAYVGDWIPAGEEYRGKRLNKGIYRNQRLSHAAEHFGIDCRGAHRARADCLITLQVLQGMADG